MRDVSRRSFLGAVGAGGITGTAGCLSLGPFGRPPEPRVAMRHAEFEPRELVIDPGETVTWYNTEVLSHTVTAYEERIPDDAAFFDSGGNDTEQQAREDWEHELDNGDRFQHTFEEPGYYRYFCVPHEDFDTMAGTVAVRTSEGDLPPPPEVASPDTDHVVSMGAWRFFPDSLTIEAGESVGWINGTGIAHSVTGRTLPAGAAYFASGGFDTEDDAHWDWYGPREGDVLPEEPFTHTFETPGAYSYYCILHETNMVGSVTVEPATGR